MDGWENPQLHLDRLRRVSKPMRSVPYRHIAHRCIDCCRNTLYSLRLGLWKRRQAFLKVHLRGTFSHIPDRSRARSSRDHIDPGAIVKIRPRKACRYPNLRSFGWVSYDKVGGLYSGMLGIRSEARASDLRSYPGLWWKRIKLHLY